MAAGQTAGLAVIMIITMNKGWSICAVNCNGNLNINRFPFRRPRCVSSSIELVAFSEFM